ncbi:ABC transporter permease [Conexibacter sp. CPCC 206217]|uniref:ABC transporter permease n=1 Tax=Conexibacter sp. CPCC 206217 TaxID=3064574 RepID=UPI002717C73B|nr:ABC transporter permease [Conexibacter sp. CPCC 206217]MDO8209954.1 ABC transporter permease [Conexibacter sp. CPCC 206217]
MNLLQRDRLGASVPAAVAAEAEAGAEAVAAPPAAPNRLRRALAVSEAGVIAALAGLVLVFWLLEPAFLSGTNVRSMLTAVSFVGIIAIGQTLLLVAGEFDLSVGSVAGLSAIVSAWLMTKGNLPVPLGILGGLATGALVGFVNGILVVGVGIPAFIATLGMLYAARGFIYVITNGYPIYPLPRAIGEIGSADVLFGLGWSFVLLVVLAVIADVVLRRTTTGRNLYATGGNAEVARLVGISTGRVKIACFMVVGALSAVAGMLVLADGASGTPAIGTGWELTVIAGVVIGGVSLFGGVGTVAAGIVGMLLLQVVQSGLVVVGVNPNWQTVAVGLIMVLAVGVDIARRRVSLAGGTS